MYPKPPDDAKAITSARRRFRALLAECQRLIERRVRLDNLIEGRLESNRDHDQCRRLVEERDRIAIQLERGKAEITALENELSLLVREERLNSVPQGALPEAHGLLDRESEAIQALYAELQLTATDFLALRHRRCELKRTLIAADPEVAAAFYRRYEPAIRERNRVQIKIATRERIVAQIRATSDVGMALLVDRNTR